MNLEVIETREQSVPGLHRVLQQVVRLDGVQDSFQKNKLMKESSMMIICLFKLTLLGSLTQVLFQI